MRYLIGFFSLLLMVGCAAKKESDDLKQQTVPEPDYTLSSDQTHSSWSSSIEPVLTDSSGAVIEVFIQEASAGQLNANSTAEDLKNLSFDPIHPLTGPVFVKNAAPGDVLKVTLHEIELGDWGWIAIMPGFGFLLDEFGETTRLKTFKFSDDKEAVAFNDKISIPLKPFPGVMGVAPATDSLLSTIPPRANGGSMDDPHLVEGTTAYFPVMVEGGLFSIGDTHAVQGMGEVSGTAIEAPMRIIYEIELIKGGRSIPEPEYETEDTYAVTAFGKTIDEAAKKANRYMIDYLEEEHGLGREEAYMLSSAAGDLRIAEVVDEPHMLVSMHIPKEVLGME